MKTKNLLTLVLSLVITTLILSLNHSAFTNDDPNPPAERTGAPGELTCATGGCHNDNALNSGDGSLSITVGEDTVSEYKGDSTYSVTVKVEDPNKSVYGFEITALDTNNEKAGTFTASSNTTVQTSSNKEYVSHSNGVSQTNSWTFEWTSPSNNVGDVTFYMAGNAANNDGNPTGDLIYTEATTLTPSFDDGNNDGGGDGDGDNNNDSTSTGVFTNNTVQNSSYKVYPTRIDNNETITISFKTKEKGTCQVHIYDIQGRYQATILNKDLPAGEHKKRVASSSFNHGNGIHFVKLITPDGKQSRSIIF